MALPNMPEAIGAEKAAASVRTGWPRLFLFVPAAVFVGLTLAFLIGLERDPNVLPSALVGKPVPTFRLPPVKGRSLGLAAGDLRGDVALVNVFASWCVACREEHPVLMRLAVLRTLPVHGLNYKDKPDDAAKWLDAMGDPYTRTGADLDGRVAIDWGVYGVPETFVVDRGGRIAFKQVGPITPAISETVILPLVAKLRADPVTGAEPNTAVLGQRR